MRFADGAIGRANMGLFRRQRVATRGAHDSVATRLSRFHDAMMPFITLPGDGLRCCRFRRRLYGTGSRRRVAATPPEDYMAARFSCPARGGQHY